MDMDRIGVDIGVDCRLALHRPALHHLALRRRAGMVTPCLMASQEIVVLFSFYFV